MRSRRDQFDGLECKMRPAADECSGVVLDEPPRQSARLQHVVPSGLSDGVCESSGLDDPKHDKWLFLSRRTRDDGYNTRSSCAKEIGD